jgi:ABC-type arginine transport system permease subunit
MHLFLVFLIVACISLALTLLAWMLYEWQERRAEREVVDRRVKELAEPQGDK